MSGKLIGNVLGTISSSNGMSHRGRREFRGVLETWKIGELQSVLDKQSTIRFMGDVVDVIGIARHIAGNDEAVATMIAPIVEGWMSRERQALQVRNILRVMGS